MVRGAEPEDPPDLMKSCKVPFLHPYFWSPSSLPGLISRISLHEQPRVSVSENSESIIVPSISYFFFDFSFFCPSRQAANMEIKTMIASGTYQPKFVSTKRKSLRDEIEVTLSSGVPGR